METVTFTPATLALAALVGAVIGSTFVFYLTTQRISGAKNEGRNESATEIARLAERLSSLGTDLEREREFRLHREGKIAELQENLSSAIQEDATLRERASRLPSMEQQICHLQNNLQTETNRCAALAEQASRIPLLEAQVSEFASENYKLTGAKEDLRADVATLTASLEAERRRQPEKAALLDEAKEKFTDVFKSLANEILEEKSLRFTEQNRTNLSQILQPLNVKIDDFKAKVDHVYDTDSNDRTALKTQVQQLMSLSERVSDDARNLTNALKGSSKTQGNWGELILETVLEAAGLRKGHEYELRPTFHYEDDTRGQPDVVIHLPEDRQIVVDAKVSLTDYERYANELNEIERDDALLSHVASVRRHIKELSEKNYQTLHGLKSLDLVVMFVPLESAFATAIAAEGALWNEGLRKNVLLVSPSSLLFVLRTVAHLWRQDDQARNVREIAKSGADLYDKFVAFIEDIKGLGKQLQKSQACYDNAAKKLSEGKGNLVSRAHRLKDLGVTPKKALPFELVESALEEPISISAVALGEGIDDR